MNNWNLMLDEYKRGLHSLNNYISGNSGDDLSSSDCISSAGDTHKLPSKRIELEYATEMYKEMQIKTSLIKKKYIDFLSDFLKSEAGSVLTERQYEIMELRAKGMSMDKIAHQLGVSKTAVHKSIHLSEDKIRKMIQE